MTATAFAGGDTLTFDDGKGKGKGTGKGKGKGKILIGIVPG